METIIKKLFEAHRTAMDKARKTRDLFGLGEPVTIAAFHDAFGIETAFEIVAGMSTTDYLIKSLQS